MKHILALAVVLIFSHTLAQGQQYTIKFATLATQGTAWMNVMKEFDEAVRKESGGRLSFRIYPGGVQGDERDVLRKIRLGQLQSAGITGVGIGEIAPRLRVLDSPFLFKSYEEIDHIHKVFEEEFERAFEEGGYVLLGWAEVGLVYVFSNSVITRRQDLRGVKMWTWEGDPVAEATFRAMGVRPIPLSITDVLTSLQTGLIDGVYCPPIAAIGLQWWTRVKYMLEYPLANASGAVVISKKYFDELPNDLKEILKQNGRTYMRKLTEISRTDNTKSIETLKRNGISLVRPQSQQIIKEYEEIGVNARKLLIHRLYPEEFLAKIEDEIARFRSNNSHSR